MHRRVAAILLSAGWLSHASLGKAASPSLPAAQWSAPWVAPAGADSHDYGVYLLRRTLELGEKPSSLVVHVTADQRYRLVVNGVEAAIGPCRGTLKHWRYETVDLAPLVHAGKNAVAAVVWHMGKDAPAAQVSHRLAFRLQAADSAFSTINSGPDWRGTKCTAYSPLPVDRKEVPFYSVTGPGDLVGAAKYPWGWMTSDFDDAAWPPAVMLDDADAAWQLVPRDIPPLEKSVDRFVAVRRAEGVEAGPEFVAGTSPITVPPHTKATILLDHGVLTNAYPELTTTGGRGAEVTLTYAEGLFLDSHKPQAGKGNRDEIEGKIMLGNHDRWLPDGGQRRIFRPLWFRTFRYVQMAVETADEPLAIDDITAEFTGYPLVQKAWFRSSDPELTKLWDVGWRTMRLCANETGYDCPYYEQLQYAGDTRTQCSFIRYLTGDDRLPRKAILDFYDSISDDGLTQSRYPSHEPQSIPPYSLFWISMIHDDYQWRGDADFVRRYIDGVQSVLAWHEKHLDPSGMLGRAPGWNFVDWSFPAKPMGGVPPQDAAGRSAILSLQLAYAYAQAAELMDACGETADAEKYRQLAAKIEKATVEACWKSDRGLIADAPGGADFSQHANVFALLTDALPTGKREAVLDKLLSDQSVRPATVYFRFYVNRALERLDEGDRYLDTLGLWTDMLKLGLTTFAEMPEPSRSDCHAWGASPGYEMLRLVAGVRPTKPGCGEVLVAPQLGRLSQIDAGVPLPTGIVSVKLHRAGRRGVTGSVTLPDKVAGRFQWGEKSLDLAAGVNEIAIAE